MSLAAMFLGQSSVSQTHRARRFRPAVGRPVERLEDRVLLSFGTGGYALFRPRPTPPRSARGATPGRSSRPTRRSSSSETPLLPAPSRTLPSAASRPRAVWTRRSTRMVPLGLPTPVTAMAARAW